VRQKYEYEFEVDPEEVFTLFMDPPYSPPSDLKWKAIDPDGVKKILVEKHDFTEERVQKTIDEIAKITKERSAQSRLEQFF
jgi:hypothetical protein